MIFTKYKLLLIFPILLLCSFNPARKYIIKAEQSIERGNLKDAKKYYLKAIEKDSMNPRANAGLGLLLCDLLDNYSEALPYLERAYEGPVKDSAYDLIYALGKCYHYNGEYERALSFYDRLTGIKDLEGEIDLGKEVEKRKADCRFAIDHRNDPINTNLYIVNAGNAINTDMPEYVPVLTPRKQLIFTSKRKDSKREKLNWLDGKYFESMYIADIENDRFKNLRRFTLPDKFLQSRFQKLHESVISLSQDGKKLFTFRNSSIYEADISELEVQSPKKILTTFNEDYYQNHAFLTRDGQTLYFTSDAEGGVGGLDIYKCIKGKDGQWSKPENLGEKINTPYDEDAPYISHDGTSFYFSSKGHPGFGNYDIYISKITPDGFTQPENLGQPLNSPGHDIFFVEDSTRMSSYFSSGRNGGYGDMDIYKILYMDKINTDCPTSAPSFISLKIHDKDSTDYSNRVSIEKPSGYRIINSEWQINGERVTATKDTLDFDYRQPGSYMVSNKVIFYCDTCLSPVIACNILENHFKKIVKADTVLASNETGTTTTGPVKIDLDNYKGDLSDEQLKEIGFDYSPILFDFDKSTLRGDAIKILDNNIAMFKKYPGLHVRLVGYTDSRGPDSYNKRLSERRAKSVQKYLLKNGVEQSQVNVIEGRGATEFINNCGKGKKCPEAAHRLNRRVIFVVATKN
jgi:outer membrane protein OmpA-like peptidoglycan-associated protein/tetratricopeptide (TPR) repeat protein